MATLTAEPRTRTVEPWMTTATAEYDNRINDRVEYYGDDLDDEGALPDGWEEELKNDPEFMAELERRSNELDAELAAGTFVGYTTDEVFARLDKKFPQLREFR